MTQLSEDQRETVGTTPLAGESEELIHLPGPTFWPLTLAIGLGLVAAGMLVHPAVVALGVLIGFVAIVGWTWPAEEAHEA